MKRMMMTICCSAMLGVSSLAMAQSGNMDKMKNDAMGKEMKVTGCVAPEEMGHYMLNNAMMSGDMMKKDAMKKDDMKPMSYALMGGDLKAHVGHKVEVTGTMADSSMMKKDTMAKPAAGEMAAMHMLNVKSVKMIASTCQ